MQHMYSIATLDELLDFVRPMNEGLYQALREKIGDFEDRIGCLASDLEEASNELEELRYRIESLEK